MPFSLDDFAFVRQIYDRFNARDIDGVFSDLADDVVWANGMEGGYVQGKPAIRDYWTRQWAEYDPRVEPLAVTRPFENTLHVEVRQIVRDREGKVLADAKVGHAFHLANGLVVRFDIISDTAAWTHGGSRA